MKERNWLIKIRLRRIEFTCFVDCVFVSGKS